MRRVVDKYRNCIFSKRKDEDDKEKVVNENVTSKREKL